MRVARSIPLGCLHIPSMICGARGLKAVSFAGDIPGPRCTSFFSQQAFDAQRLCIQARATQRAFKSRPDNKAPGQSITSVRWVDQPTFQ